MADTFSKKEREKKKAKKKQEKAEKREDRKVNNNKGKSLEDMTVYMDEYGNLVDTPPDQQGTKKTSTDGGRYRSSSVSGDEEESTGMVSLLFADKDYGFITEDTTRANIFVHISKFMEPIREKDRVVFIKKKTPKGFSALNVKKLK